MVWRKLTNPDMLIPRNLQAFYRYLSNRRPGSNQIFNAMMQATKGSTDYIQARKVCDLLVALKKQNMATNDIEYGVRKTCRMLSRRQQMVVKMSIMRKKIGDAFTDMARKKARSSKTWKETKKIVKENMRVEYLNRW